MEKIKGEKIIHQNGIYRINDGRVPTTLNDVLRGWCPTWLEHVVEEYGSDSSQDKILVRVARVVMEVPPYVSKPTMLDYEFKFQCMNLCWFIRGKPLELHNTPKQWEEYVEFNSAY